MIDPAASPLAFFVSEMIRMRTAAGLSQPALAKRLSYSASQIAKIETRQRIPKAELALKLDEVFATDGLFARLQPLVERSSVLPGGPVLSVSPEKWGAFLRMLKNSAK